MLRNWKWKFWAHPAHIQAALKVPNSNVFEEKVLYHLKLLSLFHHLRCQSWSCCAIQKEKEKEDKSLSFPFLLLSPFVQSWLLITVFTVQLRIYFSVLSNRNPEVAKLRIRIKKKKILQIFAVIPSQKECQNYSCSCVLLRLIHASPGVLWM